MVRVPTPDQKDGRRLHREQLRLKEERKAHRSRINALLITPGIDLKVRSDFPRRLEQQRRLKQPQVAQMRSILHLMGLRGMGPHQTTLGTTPLVDCTRRVIWRALPSGQHPGLRGTQLRENA